MLKSNHAILHYDRGCVFPDRLTKKKHLHYLKIGDKLLAIYRNGAGETRRNLHKAVAQVFKEEANCDLRRIHAFCKLLDDAGEFERDKNGEALRRRILIFSMAAKNHPVLDRTDHLYKQNGQRIRERISKKLGLSWERIEGILYGDFFPYQRLISFQQYPGPEALLSRYNVAQVQACFYRAEKMQIKAKGDFKVLLRYAKLARLMHEIQRLGPSHYLIDLSGPAAVLGATRRYGIHMARFIPALLACKRWRLFAQIQTPWKNKADFFLTDQDGLSSHLPEPDLFDSSLEEGFAKNFGKQREGWRLYREAEIMHQGQLAYIPDFVFRHPQKGAAYFEILGFWTPEYLQRKQKILEKFKAKKILIAAPERLMRKGFKIPGNIILYKTVIQPKSVLKALELL